MVELVNGWTVLTFGFSTCQLLQVRRIHNAKYLSMLDKDVFFTFLQNLRGIILWYISLKADCLTTVTRSEL
jgi:hypothetical protein